VNQRLIVFKCSTFLGSPELKIPTGKNQMISKLHLVMRSILFCLMVFYFAGMTAVSNAQEIILDDDTLSVNLGQQMVYLEDKTGILTEPDLSSGTHVRDWEKNQNEILNFGYTNSVYWIKGVCKNISLSDLTFLIEIAYPVLDDITVYTIRDTETTEVKMGDNLSFYSRPIEHRNFVFPLSFSPGESLEILFRVKTSSSMQIPLTLYKQHYFLDKNQTELIVLGIYYGSMISMILYNLILFLSVRDKNYLYFVLYVTCMTLFLISLNGLSYQYIWPKSIRWNNQVLVVTLSGVSLFSCLFTSGFLKVKERYPKSNLVFISIGVLAGGIIFSAYSIPYKTGIVAAILLTMAAFLWSMIITVVRLFEGYTPARFYGVACFAILSGGVILALNKFSIIPRSAITEYATQYGTIFEVIVLSFALADRLNIEKKEKTRAQNMAHEQERNARIANENALKAERDARETREKTFEIQKKSTETLEQKVIERTLALNNTLQQVSDANNEVMVSLEYASMIQAAMLPGKDKLNQCLASHFIWWMPRDIVGGDFYYVDDLDAGPIVAMADCTGHGVPGALMALVANFELKRIVKGEHCLDPGEILARLNRRVRKSLKQDTSYAISDDGLDIGICVFNLEQKSLDFAGAKMNLHFVKENIINTIQGDKKSVGYISSRPDLNYTTHRIDLSKDMTVYLFTDGLTDQLIEKTGRRFGSKRLKQLVEEYSGLPFSHQLEKLKEIFLSERGSRDQVDDITMMGFNVCINGERPPFSFDT